MEGSEDLFSELDLKLMNVKQLQKLIRNNRLKVPRLKAEMVKLLLENGIQKNGLIRPASSSVKSQEYYTGEELLSKISNIPSRIPKTDLNELRIKELIDSFHQQLSLMSEQEIDQLAKSLGLEDLPPEMVHNICEKMDRQTLGRFIQSNKKMRATCNDVYEKEKKSYQEGEVKSMMDNLIYYKNQYWFLKGNGDKNLEINYRRLNPLDLPRKNPPKELDRFNIEEINETFPDFPFKLNKVYDLPISEYPKLYDYIKRHGFELENNPIDLIMSLQESVEKLDPNILNNISAVDPRVTSLLSREQLELLIKLLEGLNQALLQNDMVTARQLVQQINNIKY